VVTIARRGSLQDDQCGVTAAEGPASPDVR